MLDSEALLLLSAFHGGLRSPVYSFNGSSGLRLFKIQKEALVQLETVYVKKCLGYQ
jgi:hypothetical protein